MLIPYSGRYEVIADILARQNVPLSLLYDPLRPDFCPLPRILAHNPSNRTRIHHLHILRARPAIHSFQMVTCHWPLYVAIRVQRVRHYGNPAIGTGDHLVLYGL